jgi:hypothetical protein
MRHASSQTPLAEWLDECVWWQLKSERHDAQRLGDDYGGRMFLANLEAEWTSRQLCSRCFREIDQPLAELFAELEARTSNSEDKLGRIRKAVAERADIILRPEIVRILDEP